MLSAYAAASLVTLIVVVRRGALRPSLCLLACFVVFVLASDVLVMALAGTGLRTIAGWPFWLVLSKWLLALGEEAARGVATRFAIERRPLSEALVVAFLSGLLLGLLERLAATALTGPVDLPIPLQIAGHLRATLGHPALSVLIVVLRLRWRISLIACVVLTSLVHAANNLAADLVRTDSLLIELVFAYGLFIALFTGILAWGWRLAREGARRIDSGA